MKTLQPDPLQPGIWFCRACQRDTTPKQDHHGRRICQYCHSCRLRLQAPAVLVLTPLAVLTHNNNNHQNANTNHRIFAF